MLKIKITKINGRHTSYPPEPRWGTLNIDVIATCKPYWLLTLVVLPIIFILLFSVSGLCSEQNTDSINITYRVDWLLCSATLLLGVTAAIIKLPTLGKITSSQVLLLSVGEKMDFFHFPHDRFSLHNQSRFAVRLAHPDSLDSLKNISKPIELDAFQIHKKQNTIENTLLKNRSIKNISLSDSAELGKTYLTELYILPFARMLIGKLLQPEVNNENKKNISRKGALWFAFVTHRHLIAFWLSINAWLMIFIRAFTHYSIAIDKNQIALAMCIIPIAWCLVCIYMHKTIILQWIQWSDYWDREYFGNSSVYSEEINSSKIEWIFQPKITHEPIKDFGLDSASIFQITASIFLVLSITILQLIK
jgi:hypothetical protein